MKIRKVIPVILLLALFAMCAPAFWPKLTTFTMDPNERQIKPSREVTKLGIIEQIMSEMTIDEKIAQMLIIAPRGQELTDEMRARLASVPYGGYILMSENMTSLAETRAYVQSLQAASKTPLIIATDQEGGVVQRLRSIYSPRSTYIPSMYDLGQTNNIYLAKEVGRVMAEEMRVVGINVDFAPDADVLSNQNNTVIGRRSFSSDPEIVARMSYALAQGLEENGVVATYKHFPGHGNTTTDSHYYLPVINLTREQLEFELIPFKNAITHNAAIIMAGHIALPKITGDNTPATLSRVLLTDILRGELGFGGIIATDGLNMGALSRNYAESDIYYRTVEAGADLLVMPPNPDLAIQSIKEHISEERIDESVYRIMALKVGRLMEYSYLDYSYFGNEEHNEIVKQITN